jgi:hypothetical protein
MQTRRLELIRIGLCAVLVLFTITLNFLHVWDILQIDPGARHAIAATFFSEVFIVVILIITLIASGLFLFRATFKIGVCLQALSVLIVIALELRVGHTSTAVQQVPFLCATAVMFYLGYPFEVKETE